MSHIEGRSDVSVDCQTVLVELPAKISRPLLRGRSITFSGSESRRNAKITADRCQELQYAKQCVTVCSTIPSSKSSFVSIDGGSDARFFTLDGCAGRGKMVEGCASAGQKPHRGMLLKVSCVEQACTGYDANAVPCEQ